MMLHFLPRYTRDILTGKKRATVRLGKKGVKKGDIVFLSSGGRPFAKVKVIRVEYKKLKDLTPDQIKKEGHSSFSELIHDLRTIYPVISPEDYVTYIEWVLLEK